MAPQRPDAGRSAFLFTLTFLLLVLAGAVGGQLPGVPATVSALLRPAAAGWPQHWRFFTGGERTRAWVAWQIGAGGTLTPLTIPLVAAADLGGLSRRAHAQLAETSGLVAQVPATGWHGCAGADRTACARAAAAGPPITLDNAAQTPTICGAVLLTVERPPLRRTDKGFTAEVAVAAAVRCG
ncbi:hypothetical protein [Actinoplanes sp. N902-109]|uniref:hypothetical protein n=1 Tax=Actinoplanes sp. (strain N902-109) TaxID=649831 RepID=UPI00032965F7|nr:hypothetical protein [Actinoplanes sp. N902-109]AGL17025.1 hypothetical protein L083_3515 [Actinoplanes sp. N902-109]